MKQVRTVVSRSLGRSGCIAAVWFLVIAHSAFAQPAIPRTFDSTAVRILWPNLTHFDFQDGRAWHGGHVYYDAATTKLINRQRGTYSTTDMLFADDVNITGDIVLFKTKISPGDAIAYYVVFTEGGSHDPEFYFIPDTSSTGDPGPSVPAEILILPGNGIVYTLAHANRTFLMHQKFVLKGAEFVEVQQPYYYVGLTTTTLIPVKLTSLPTGGAVVAELPKGSTIEILLSNEKEFQGGRPSYLARTPFGLVGWLNYEIHQTADVLEGIYFEGD